MSVQKRLFGLGFWLVFWPCVGGLGLTSLALAGWMAWGLATQNDVLQLTPLFLTAPGAGLGAALWAAAMVRWAMDRAGQVDPNLPPEEAAAALHSLRGRPRRMLGTACLLCLILGLPYYALTDHLLLPARLGKAQKELDAFTAQWDPHAYDWTLTSDGFCSIGLATRNWPFDPFILPLATHARLESTEGLYGSWDLDDGGHGWMGGMGYMSTSVEGQEVPPYLRGSELTVDWLIILTLPGRMGFPETSVTTTKRTKIAVDPDRLRLIP